MELEILQKYSQSQLYEILEASFEDGGLGAIPQNDKEKSEKGYYRFIRILKQTREDLCKSNQFQELLRNQKKYKKLEAAAVVSDIIISITGMATLSVFTFSLILISYGLDTICSKKG
ncbi:hypothetical protein [Ascidiimonas sp. W6]|uniref:hypothetical protein n=1 Tax=Ascidiimonas meishanensis TaxID=3128903 RepID=UPI0030EDEB61